jgi:hypothetical protein
MYINGKMLYFINISHDWVNEWKINKNFFIIPHSPTFKIRPILHKCSCKFPQDPWISLEELLNVFLRYLCLGTFARVPSMLMYPVIWIGFSWLQKKISLYQREKCKYMRNWHMIINKCTFNKTSYKWMSAIVLNSFV